MREMVASSDKPRLCFVAHFAYGAMAGGTTGHIGGVERQTSLLAKWFAERGYRVSIITWDEGQEDDAVIDGVRVLKTCRQDAGIPGLRFFWPRWSSLNAAMERASADIYYQNCAEYVTGQVALWCHRHRRKFVYSVASDPDCDKSLPKMHSRRERVLYRYGVKTADRLIVQTQMQRRMLRTNFGRDSLVIPMPCPGPSDEEWSRCGRVRDGSPRVLWIGRLYEVKRPDRLLDVAELCPDLQFDVVGQMADSEYARKVCERAKSSPNVIWHGPVSRDRVLE
jgi:glycosyltransferase involved in cell wall biosynthesis